MRYRFWGQKKSSLLCVPLLSRPQALPPQPLAERYVNLSIHTAPIRQTHLSFPPANERTSLDIDPQSSPETVLP
jgi:hypothetical protein